MVILFNVFNKKVNNIKSTFSIKDLENLTGIKAHTIRIWEKRYNLLQPDRSDTNIRNYDLSSLQKLLNVSYLNNFGYKISKISLLDNSEIKIFVSEIAAKESTHSHAINAFKLSMLNFDQRLFYNTYNGLEKTKTFKEIFEDVFIPLLQEIGLLWQTDTITTAHEHFLTSLIRQKILVLTEQIQSTFSDPNGKTYVLFLPDNEVHELGIMYLNYLIVSKGFHSIFLGQSVPIDGLVDLLEYYDKITFISFFTVKPEKEMINDYMNEFESKILKKEFINFKILGRMTEYIDNESLSNNIKIYKSINNVISDI